MSERVYGVRDGGCIRVMSISVMGGGFRSLSGMYRVKGSPYVDWCGSVVHVSSK